MSLTPEERIALGKACALAGFAPSANRPMGLFAAAIAHERARCAWQPIESAPKDGTNVLLLREAHDCTVGRFNATRQQWASIPNDYRIRDAIAWFPIPEPPEVTR